MIRFSSEYWILDKILLLLLLSWIGILCVWAENSEYFKIGKNIWKYLKLSLYFKFNEAALEVLASFNTIEWQKVFVHVQFKVTTVSLPQNGRIPLKKVFADILQIPPRPKLSFRFFSYHKIFLDTSQILLPK